MCKILTVLAVAATLTGVAEGKIIPGDSKRGSDLIRTQGCINCHRIAGEGGTVGPDLGKARGRNYTPSSMASTMWNHAPAMWATMEKQGATRPSITEEGASDLYAYFQSIRYFEKPGDAGRGKQIFAAKHCADCHGRSAALAGGAPAITSWASITSPIVFAQRMWNHAPEMEKAMAARKIKWARLTAAELTDIQVYIQSLPETRGRVKEFSLDNSGRGEAVFAEKGCRNCHQGKLDLDKKMVAGTVIDFAVAMWNHAPAMAEYGRAKGQAPPKLDGDEMRALVTYFWDKQIFAEQGNAAKGKGVFAKKNCVVCHEEKGGGAPDMKQWVSARTDTLRPFSMTSVLWQHGPSMLEKMKAKKLEWPVFSTTEMLDLIAYLNSLNTAATKAD